MVKIQISNNKVIWFRLYFTIFLKMLIWLIPFTFKKLTKKEIKIKEL